MLTTAVVLVTYAAYFALGDLLQTDCIESDSNSLYDYSLKEITGPNYINLSDYRGKQEPAPTGEKILNGLKYVQPGNGFEPAFPMSARVDVNGKNEIPLYTFLKSLCPRPSNTFSDVKRLNYEPLKQSDVSWNFEKFLIDREGKPVRRYDPSVEPEQITNDILYLLQRKIQF